MKYRRAFAAATACKGKIYVCGGWGEYMHPLRSVECFDPVSGSWIELTEMPRPRAGHSLTACGNKLILAGGHNGRKYSLSILEINPHIENGKWEKLPPMGDPRPDISGIALGQALFTIGKGGASNPLRVEIFDGNSWQEGPPLPFKSLFHSALLISQSLAGRLCKYQDKYAYYYGTEDDEEISSIEIPYDISPSSSSSSDSLETISEG